MTDLRPGSTAWRISARGAALRCVVKRVTRGTVFVTASTLSTATWTFPAAEVFADKAACRAEIQRRAALNKDRTSFELPPGVTRGMPPGKG